MPTKARKIAAPKHISADEFMFEFNRLVAKHLSKTPKDQHSAAQMRCSVISPNYKTRPEKSVQRQSNRENAHREERNISDSFPIRHPQLELPSRISPSTFTTSSATSTLTESCMVSATRILNPFSSQRSCSSCSILSNSPGGSVSNSSSASRRYAYKPRCFK